MQSVSFEGYELEVDYDKTINYYKNLPFIGEKEHCDCSYCKNYVLTTNTFPMIVKDLLQEIGVNPKKGAEVSHFYEEENGKHMYVADYRLYGKLLKSPISKTSKIYYVSNNDYFQIGFESVNIYENTSEKIGFWIEAFLPWIVDLDSE
ncbi:hypothetical protein JF544_12620 [Halobacillus kuroshimensis]|uniref:Uncharacterized protein n=1 Tax=Halobacillus kuroshimensis TaxID=302481 RepID=A0ABS3DXL9_9BACI|nr:hypothetical protein [Halobacillus kuroshimensis]MBN8236100.1 hypothetical protein [Halobacillus kuroshimensis]